MSEKKTTLQSLRNQNWKIVKIEIEKIINKRITHTSANNITELNELIYAGVNLVSTKIDVSQKNTNRNSKPG